MGFLSDLFKAKNSISGEEVKELLKDKNYVVVDVRTKEEYNDKHVPGAINSPVEMLNGSKLSKYKNKTIIVYCRTGVRSARASKILEADGYIVKDMGGINNYPF